MLHNVFGLRKINSKHFFNTSTSYCCRFTNKFFSHSSLLFSSLILLFFRMICIYKILYTQYLAEFPDFEKDGLQVAELIKKHLDETWSPSWHVIIGKNFGSLCTHETKRFLYFYTGDKAVMIFKAGGAP